MLREVEQISGGVIRPQVATLYRTLDRLVAEGLIEEHATDVVDGRFRRSYRLTTAGAGLLGAEASRRASTAALAAARLGHGSVTAEGSGATRLAGGGS